MFMKFRVFIVVAVTALLHQQCSHAQAFYGSVIKLDAGTYNLVKEEVNDLQLQLHDATGQNFTIDIKDTSTANGIQIRKLDLSSAAKNDQRIDTANDDAVLIKSDGQHYLTISAYTKQGLVNGIYTYLDTLGFKWYHPGDAWAYIPHLKDVRIKCNHVFIPDFALRTFFGTWGTPRNGEVDKKGIVNKAWGTWYTRNRMGGGYSLAGHSWNEFLWANISEFNRHPEYMAEVNGERVKPNTAQKFCISNKGLQDIFVQGLCCETEKKYEAPTGAQLI